LRSTTISPSPWYFEEDGEDHEDCI